MIRIAHVFTSLNRGGAETMLMNIYRKIDRTQIQFDFVVHSSEKEHAFSAEIREMGGNIYHVPAYKGHNYFAVKKAWDGLFKKTQWMAVHGHFLAPAFIYFALAKKYGVKAIAHAHNTSTGTGINAFVKKLFRPLANSYVDHFVTCSDKASYFNFGSKHASKAMFIPNAIDTKLFSFNEEIRDNMRKMLSVEDLTVYGHVASFREVKNHMFLLDVFAEICKKENNSVLVLVGDGPDGVGSVKQNILTKVQNLGIKDKVIMLGIREDIAELFNAMDVMIFPSFFEGLSVSLIEAQSTGLPVLMSDTITKEVILAGDIVTPLSLSTSDSIWADRAISMANFRERSISDNEAITRAGYDINASIEKVQGFYLGLK